MYLSDLKPTIMKKLLWFLWIAHILAVKFIFGFQKAWSFGRFYVFLLIFFPEFKPFIFGLYLLEQHLSSDFLRILKELFSYLELLLSLKHFLFDIVEIIWFVSNWLKLKVVIGSGRLGHVMRLFKGNVRKLEIGYVHKVNFCVYKKLENGKL